MKQVRLPQPSGRASLRSDRDRHTACERKRRHVSPRAAEQHVAELGGTDRARIYRCAYCRLWHVTSIRRPA